MSEFNCLVVVLFSAMFSCFLLDSFELQEMVCVTKHGATFGIRDVKVRERLLRESQLTLISRYTSQIIALLAVNYAATVVDLTILQPFVEVESAETQKTTQALRLLTKRQTMAMIQTKFI